jgi:hypothetical protein
MTRPKGAVGAWRTAHAASAMARCMARSWRYGLNSRRYVVYCSNGAFTPFLPKGTDVVAHVARLVSIWRCMALQQVDMW